jgi:hypothetical protein
MRGGQSALRAVLAHGDFYRAAAADCGCHDNARQADLGVEQLEAPARVPQRPRQELERDRRPEREVLGAVHLAHAAATDQLHDAITRRQDRARRELGLGGERAGAAAEHACRAPT